MSKQLFVQAALARTGFGNWNNHPLMDEAEGGDGLGAGSGGGAADDGDKGEGDKSGAGEGDKGKAGEGDKSGSGDKKGSGDLSDSEAKLLKEVMDKKGTIKDLKGELAKFDGIDLDKYKALMDAEAKRAQEQSDAEKKRLEEQGNFSRLKEQMVSEHEKETQTLNDTIAQLQKENADLKSERVELSVGNAFGSSKYIAEKTNLSTSKARIIYGSHFEVENGQVVPYDKPAGAADRTMLIDGRGDPLTFDKAIEKLVEADPDRDLLIRSTIKPGSSSDSKGSLPGSKKDSGSGNEGKGVHKITAGIGEALAAASKKK